MLELLVNHYREPMEVVERFLASVDMQRDVDFSGVLVTICNDGDEVPLTNDVIIGHPYEVRYMEADRGGVSHTRNALLDASTGDYLLFCDCDDLLSGYMSLNRTMTLCEGYDVMVPAILREHMDGGSSVSYRSIHMLQGKAFRRQFLMENDIRFCDEMVVSGDPYMTWQAILMTGKVRHSTEPLYIWTFNHGSVCRCEEDHFHRIHWCHVEVAGMLADRFRELGRHKDHLFFVQRLVVQSYFIMHQDEWLRHRGEFRCRFAVRCLSWWLAKYYDTYLAIPEQDRRDHYRRTVNYYKFEPDGGFDGIDAWARDVMASAGMDTMSLNEQITRGDAN